MKEINKRLAALVMAGFMIGSTSGCSNNNNNEDPIRYEINEQTNESQLVGTITLDELKDYYIIEINDFENQSRFYLTRRSEVLYARSVNDYNYRVIGSELILVSHKINSTNYKCEYGEVKNIVNFIQYIQKYSSIKGEYSAEEINNIYNNIVEDNNQKIKTNTK